MGEHFVFWDWNVLKAIWEGWALQLRGLGPTRKKIDKIEERAEESLPFLPSQQQQRRRKKNHTDLIR